jgi:hypothetical protein
MAVPTGAITLALLAGVATKLRRGNANGYTIFGAVTNLLTLALITYGVIAA